MVAPNPADTAGTSSKCVGCGTELALARTGRRRKYCTDACRKASGRISSGKRPAESISGRGSGRRQETPSPSHTPTPTSSFSTSLTQIHTISSPPDISAAQDPNSGQGTEPDGVSGQILPWYYAKFAAPAGQDVICDRRRLRYRLRSLLRQVTQVQRCKGCGFEPIAGGIVIKKTTDKGGRTSAGFGGLETCGRIWLCPVCAAKIRVRRGDEVAEGVGRHISDEGDAWFVTATMPHEHGDALKDSFDALTKAWRYVTSGRAHQREKDDYGIIGTIKAIEVTHGQNGWHPHIHAVILTTNDVSTNALCDWFGRLDARWAEGLRRAGWASGKLGIRFRLDPVTHGTAGLAAYVTKVQDAGLGNELARADMKDGKKGSRTPFQILADFGNTGLADDLDLWWEYEEATTGRSAIRWSKGLRALLLPDQDEKTDEEIAAEEHDGESVAVLARNLWFRLRRIDGAEIAVLEAVEASGWDGLIRTLIRYRLDPSEAYTPEEWATPNVVDIGPD